MGTLERIRTYFGESLASTVVRMGVLANDSPKDVRIRSKVPKENLPTLIGVNRVS